MVRSPKFSPQQRHKQKQVIEQNYGKGRPKKKQASQFQIVEKHWFFCQRAFNVYVLICEKGSLALRYRTGQQRDEAKRKPCDTSNLKNKLKELKKHCKIDEKAQYLLIQDNTASLDILEGSELHEEMNLIYKYMDRNFQATFKLILENYIQYPDIDPCALAVSILQLINNDKDQHKQFLDLALIKTNIEKDLEYVLNQEEFVNYEIKTNWTYDLNLINDWIIQFITQMIISFHLQENNQE
ncbi:hypothetical protein pb186bvf_017441 [Paramecium bursaria]